MCGGTFLGPSAGFPPSNLQKKEQEGEEVTGTEDQPQGGDEN